MLLARCGYCRTCRTSQRSVVLFVLVQLQLECLFRRRPDIILACRPTCLVVRVVIVLRIPKRLVFISSERLRFEWLMRVMVCEGVVFWVGMLCEG